MVISVPGATVSGWPKAMFAIVSVGPAIAAGLSLVALVVASAELPDPPQAVASAATTAIAASNIPIFFTSDPFLLDLPPSRAAGQKGSAESGFRHRIHSR